MYYQLLGPVGSYESARYRGTQRCGPTYYDDLPPDSPPNVAFLEYVSDHGQRLDDPKRACQLASIFAEWGQYVDVVGVEAFPAAPVAPSVPGQLGFDVDQHGWNSLLSWGLTWKKMGHTTDPLRPLLALVETVFRPRLNAHGLFADWEDARFFLDVVESLSALAPGTWEAPGHECFEIVRLTALVLAEFKEQDQPLVTLQK